MKKAIQLRAREKILILDGAMGTMIQNAELSAEDYGGDALEGCSEILNQTRPDLIQKIHESYLSAGADIIETNTFGATPIVLAEYGLQNKTEELNSQAVECAKRAVAKYTTEEQPRYIAGAMGPTTKTLFVTGGVTFEELVRAYYLQARALLAAGVDLLLLETAQDTLNVKAGTIAIQQASEELGITVPLMISGTIEPMGTTLAGQNIEAFYLSLKHVHPFSIGLNCATGPEFMTDHLRTLSRLADCAVSCYPNAGLPDEDGRYLETPYALAEKLKQFAEKGWLNIAGGCCGTTPEHIKAIAKALKDISPRKPVGKHLPATSGIEAVYLEEENRPILVGERTNVIGSRKFRQLIAQEAYEEAAEIGRKQVKNGAQIVDICLADPDRDELADMEAFLRYVTKKVKVPLMIDSTNVQVMEKALTYSQGKAILNSVNLEEGEERFQEVAAIVKKYGAAVVVGLIDEAGMAITRERKLEVARRSYQLLVNKYGIVPEDIIFDPLVFPVGTGDEQYIGSAKETIEAIRAICKEFPSSSTILGISNVSFGLPMAGREVLNSVYLYEATKAGLHYAIVNTEKLERYASISEQERKLAEDLLFQTNKENYEAILSDFTNFYRQKKETFRVQTEELTVEERLKNAVIEGSKESLIEDLQEALHTYKPLDIINGPLMDGMEEVGRLFNENQLIVAEVLQSAEVMKASVTFLKPFMEKTDTTHKGKILLATVKGDVHDIGKNLVEIILSNNGFEVIDLGIKVPPEKLIQASIEEKPDAIGLSGLLVKSAQQMVVTAQDLKTAGIQVPLLVGGAALSRKFTKTRIAPEYNGPVFYAKDAMHGLEIANQLAKNGFSSSVTRESHVQVLEKPLINTKQFEVTERSNVSQNVPLHQPPDFEPHLFRDVPLSLIFPYVNLQMLLGKHLGLKGNVEKLLKEKDQKALELLHEVKTFWKEIEENKWLCPSGIYQFFPVQSKRNQILVYDPKTKAVRETFHFPRQEMGEHLCLADFVRSVDSGEMDSICIFTVTAGLGVSDLAKKWKQEGEYLRSHMIQAIALEVAEAFAERLHETIRDQWGFPDPIEMTMKERFGARYQGIRVSFGYPACPNLEEQTKLFRLLQPEKIGVRLTEGLMMEPEASVSALVFAHPEARYFSTEIKRWTDK